LGLSSTTDAQREETTVAHTKAIMVGIAQGHEKIAKSVEERPRQPR
jgi:hypothetical protein